LKIAVVDDHPLARKGITSILSLEDNFEVVGEAGNLNEAVDVICKTRPDISLLDLRLGRQSGLDVIKELKGKGVNTKFVILTSSSEEDDFQKAEEAGVDGYILKEAFPDEIVYAVNVISRGRKYFDPSIVGLIMHYDEDEPIKEKLTPREKEVLEALGEGLCNKDIAKKLFITEFTVKKHVSQIFDKLNLTDRTQAALYANKKRYVRTH
jgi:two-component system, NarL family, nitrate/nitrite response regulator NarL